MTPEDVKRYRNWVDQMFGSPGFTTKDELLSFVLELLDEIERLQADPPTSVQGDQS